MKKSIYLHTNNDTKVELSLREVTALNLCRKVLEECSCIYNDRYVIAPGGEMITFVTAVEILDGILEKNKGKLA